MRLDLDRIINPNKMIEEIRKKQEKFESAVQTGRYIYLHLFNEYLKEVNRQLPLDVMINNAEIIGYSHGRYGIRTGKVEMPDETTLLERGFLKSDIIEQIEHLMRKYERNEWISEIIIDF